MIFAVTLIAVSLTAQPAKTPKEKGIPKSSSAQNAANPKGRTKTEEPTQTPNPPTSTTASQAPSQTGNSNAASNEENEKTQRWIEIFTGVLASVGVLQLVVMFFTLLVYCRQAKIMRHQSHEMTRQRVTMHGQLKAMQHQLSEMGEQTKVLKDSVAHAGTSAESALRSVKLQEAQLKQWLDIEEFNVRCTPIQANTVEATLTISFQINNPTKMVLTLKEITTTLFDEGPESSALEYTLAPDHAYPFQMDVIISGQSFLKYMKDVFVIPVSGLIGFDDAFGERQHYGFGLNCHCRYPNWFKLRTYEGKIPKKEST